jgi:hypothetical protein
MVCSGGEMCLALMNNATKIAISAIIAALVFVVGDSFALVNTFAQVTTSPQSCKPTNQVLTPPGEQASTCGKAHRP